MNNSYFLIQTKRFNLQGVFAGNTYNTHVFVNLTTNMCHFFLDEYMYIIYTSDIISMDSTGTQPPQKSKNNEKKPSLKNLPPASRTPTSTSTSDGRKGHHGDAPKIVGTPWSLRPSCFSEGVKAGRGQCSSKGKVGENPWERVPEIQYIYIYIPTKKIYGLYNIYIGTPGRVQKRYVYINIYHRYMEYIILWYVMVVSGNMG